MSPPAVGIEDEFDALPDEFEGVNWEAIPELNNTGPQPGETNQSQEDQSLAPTTVVANVIVHSTEVDVAPSPRVRESSANPSSDYAFDDVDDSFLAAVDVLEFTLTQAPAPARAPDLPHHVPSNLSAASSWQDEPPSSSATSSQHANPNSESPTSPRKDRTPRRKRTLRDTASPHKRARSCNSPKVASPEKVSPTKHVTPKDKGKGKGKAPIDPHEGVKRLLEGFEDELTCPICCDILACAHLGNPCGHSFCGECGWDWIARNPRAPTCAICRGKLSRGVPMIPNFAMDNTIEKHISALGQSNVDGWGPAEAKLVEWNERKERWKAGAAQRAAGAKKAPAVNRSTGHLPPVIAEFINLVDYDDPNDEDYQDSGDEQAGEGDVEVIAVPAPVNQPVPLPAPPAVPVPTVAANQHLYQDAGGSGRGRGGRGGGNRGRHDYRGGNGGESGGRNGRSRQSRRRGGGGGDNGGYGSGAGDGGWRGRARGRGRGGGGNPNVAHLPPAPGTGYQPPVPVMIDWAEYTL